MSPSVALLHEGREVFFHPDYSCGTAAVRGSEPLGPNAEHYWEIKMTSAVYGTDMVHVFVVLGRGAAFHVGLCSSYYFTSVSQEIIHIFPCQKSATDIDRLLCLHR